MPSAGRVIAGRAGGLRLAAPGGSTRPLADRVKETLFAILDPDLRGSVFLDCCAGSGAAGIEALSRGAARATFVERDGASIRTIEANLGHTRLADSARVVRADVLAYLREGAADDRPFDVVFIDPPYADTGLATAVLGLLGDPARGLVSERAVVVLKHFWRDRPEPRIGLLASVRERRFGETALTFYRVGSAASDTSDRQTGVSDGPPTRAPARKRDRERR
jgi:16S rRNA (guanine966-N2)-methyltransferase